MGMRGLETPVRKIRRQVFREVSKVAFESTSENLIEEIEEIPYRLVTEDGENIGTVCIVRELLSVSVYALRWECLCVQKTVRFILQQEWKKVIFLRSIMSRRSCRLCHPRVLRAKSVDMRSAICVKDVWHIHVQRSVQKMHPMVNGHSYIDQSKCIKCGKCKSACPYDAIAKERPCARACR